MNGPMHTLAIAIGAGVGAWCGAPWGVAVIVAFAITGALAGHFVARGLHAKRRTAQLRAQVLGAHQVSCEVTAQQLMQLAQAHRPAGVSRQAVDEVELVALLTTYYCALVTSGALTDEARRARIKEAAISRAVSRLMDREVAT